MLPAFCSNLLPEESWSELLPALLAFSQQVRAESGLDRIGIDLRLGSQAIAQAERDSCRRWRDSFAQAGIPFTTLNAFPLRPFQAAVVKDQAYAPDWGSEQRLQDSIRCIEIIDALCAEDQPLCSISTLPGSYQPWGADCPSPQHMAQQYGLWAAAAHQHRHNGGRRCVLCIEPEPCCSFGSAEELAAFWQEHRHAAHAAATYALGSSKAGEDAITQHLATCWDTCHASVMHEDQAEGIRRLSQLGLPPYKVQFSAAPVSSQPPQAAAIEAMIAMDEPRFYHQVGLLWSEAQGLRREVLPDIPDLAQRWRHEWQGQVPDTLHSLRCHFHIPVDGPGAQPPLASSINESRAGLAAALQHGAQHISVETYTWSLLADSNLDRVQGTARELLALAAALPD